MTKPPLYAAARPPLQLGLLAAAVTIACLATPRTAEAQPAPCAQCIVPSLAPGQTLALPQTLNGLEVLVRVPADEPRTAISALRSIQASDGV
ncbi:MAG TPA: hypothetical protein VG106_08915, partial [Vicinamibacterales bacterium]|nr:hypothetical protein [Vicinamibacterales bacterium]